MGRAWCECVTSKPERVGLLLGLCDGLFAHGEGGSGDICGCGHSGWREKGKGSMEKWTIELKYRKAYPTRRDMPLPPVQSHSLLLLRILVQAHISRICLSLLTIFTSTHHTRFIPLARIPFPQYSQILTIPYCLSFRLDTSPTLGGHHSRIIFGDLIRHRRSVRRCYARNSASSRTSVTIDNFIIVSVLPMALLLKICL
jgi:hypothetical protein